MQSRQDVSSTKELCGYTELHLDLTEKTNRELFNAVLKAKFMSCTTAEEVFQFDKLSMSAAAGSKPRLCFGKVTKVEA